MHASVELLLPPPPPLLLLLLRSGAVCLCRVPPPHPFGPVKPAEQASANPPRLLSPSGAPGRCTWWSRGSMGVPRAGAPPRPSSGP